MKYNKPLLVTSLLLLMASPALFAGDDANGSGTGEGAGATNGTSPGDTQTITVTVPEVSLIDVTNTLSATLVAPTDAGDNFTEVTVPGTPDYDISANVLEGTSNTRKIVATTSDVPSGWEFTFNMTAPTASGASAGDVTFSNSDNGSGVDLVTDIENVAQKNIGLTIKIGPENANEMPSYTAGAGKAVAIVYTITADQ